MTATIDKRIVEMSFENQRFERGVGDSIRTIDKLKNSLNFRDAHKSFDGINDAAGRVNLSSMAQGVESIAGRFSALGVIGIGVLLNLTNSAIEAGKRIANALVIDPIKTGYSEFELKMGSIQTIMAGTGESLETVNQKLNELNEYSDKTIYSFADMTTNIGKFTNAGVSLDDSVAAIQGIANAAALSGANANEASRSMYNFAQAISAGHVKLIDWKSIELANMATKEFKQQIIDTAVEIGTLTKAGDEYRTSSGEILTATKNFNNSLQDQWFTTDVLTKVLGKYSDETSDIGKRATAAAQDVKTLSMLYDTLKEAAQSGWAQTWEIVVGDFEEGKKLFTGLSQFFGSIIGGAAEARNTLLGGWKELGGRTKLLDALKNTLDGIMSIIGPIKDGFRDIFPAITAQQLLKFSEILANLTSKLVLSGDTANVIRRIFRGVFAVFDIGRMAVVAIAKQFGRLLEALSPVPGSLGDILASVGDWLVSVRDLIKANDTFGKVMKVVGDIIIAVTNAVGIAIAAVAPIISSVVNAIKKAVDRFKELKAGEGFLKAFTSGIQAFFDYFKTLDFEIITGFIERLKARFEPLKNIFGFFEKGFDDNATKLSPIQKKLTEIREKVTEGIKKLFLGILDAISKIDFSSIDFSKSFDALNSGLLAALLLSITQFVRKGTGIFGSIVDIFKNVSGFAENANGILANISNIFLGVKDVLMAYQQQLRAGILLKIAGAVAILAASLIALSLVDSEKLTGALASITALFANLFGAMAIYEKTSSPTGIPGMAKGIAGMIGLSVAVLILSGALVNLAQIPGDQLIKGIVGITAVMGVLLLMSKGLAGQEGTMVRGALSLVIFGVALRTMLKPIKELGAMDTGQMTQGLIGLAAMLGEIVIFIKTMNFNASNMEDIFGLLILSGAITVMSGVIKQLGALDASTLSQGLTVLGIMLAGLAGFSKIATGGGLFILTATGMVILAGAMVILAEVIKTIGSMSMEEVGTALVGMAGSLLIFAVAMNAMNGAIIGAAALLVAAGALAILAPALKLLGSMSLEQVGIGLLALAGAFTVLGLAASILTPLLPSLLLLGGAVAIIGVAMLAAGAGVLFFATGLATLVAIGAAGGAALTATLVAVAATLPIFAAALAMGIIAFAKTIKEGGPVIYEAAATMFLAFIKAITETTPQVVEMILDFIQTLLTTLAERLPDLITAGYDVMVNFMTGIRDNLPKIVPLALEIIAAYLDGIAQGIPGIVDSGWNLIISWIDGMSAAVEKNLPRLMESVQNLSIAIIKGLITGLNNGRNNAVEAIKEIAAMLISAFKDFLGIHSPSTVFFDLAGNIIVGLTDGLRAKISSVTTPMIELGKKIVDTVKNKVGDMKEVGKDLVRGFAEGIQNQVGAVVEKARQMAQAVINAIANTIDSHSPSRVTMEMGRNVDEGFAIGITKFSGSVVDATKEMAKEAVSGLGLAVSKISDMLSGEMNLEPTITPVLDLSSVVKDGSRIQSLLGGKTLNLSTTANRVPNIQLGRKAEAVSSADPVAAKPQVSFVQNNYSPKELSRLDIYRQTRNQLAQIKNVGGI